jgi:hypothetical protein
MKTSVAKSPRKRRFKKPSQSEIKKWLVKLKNFGAEPLFPNGRKERKPTINKIFD